jgi:squalene synthase HpnC
MPTTSHPAASPASVDPLHADADGADANPGAADPAPAALPPLPATIEMAFAPLTSPQAAQSYTWQLAHSHYENFSVISVLLPRHLRQDFCNVYAFCRIADDLSDEVVDRDESLRLLERFRAETLAMYAGTPRTIVFAALAETVQRYEIPIQPFLDLVDAFEQDQRVDRYDTFAQLVDYCRRSADPVGRLVLYMCGYRDEQRQRLSDRTCTALQLANFWQDVRRDIVDRDRIYLPRETMQQFGVSEQQIKGGGCDDNYRKCIQFEVDRTEAMFAEGDALLPLLNEAVRPQVSLFSQGGRAILEAIRRQDYDTLTNRPSLSRWQKGRLVFGAVAARIRQVVEVSA